MRVLTKSIAAAIVAIFLGGCAATPSQDEFARADFGSPPARAERDIEAYFAVLLKDPAAAEYRSISDPVRYWMRDQRGLVNGGDRILYGWAVEAQVNAKNSYGGYVGFRTYRFLFRADEIVFVQED